MLRAINLGAIAPIPVYPVRSFRILGQEDFIDTAGEEPAYDIDQELIDEEPATTSEATPSSLNPSSSRDSSSSSSSSSSSGGGGFLNSVGNFFGSLFTPSNITAAASAVKASQAKKSSAPPGTLPLVPPASGMDTGTLLIVGGLTFAAVVVVAIATRK